MSLCLPKKTPGPHFGHVKFLRLIVSPEISYKALCFLPSFFTFSFPFLSYGFAPPFFAMLSLLRHFYLQLNCVYSAFSAVSSVAGVSSLASSAGASFASFAAFASSAAFAFSSFSASLATSAFFLSSSIFFLICLGL